VGGDPRERGVVIAGTLVAELGRVTVVHHANPPAIGRRLARRARVKLVKDPSAAVRLADELDLADTVRALGVTDGDPAKLAAVLDAEEADRALLAERDRALATPPPPPDLDQALERLAELAAAVRHSRAAEARARARLDAAAEAAGAAEPAPLTRVDPEAARAVAQRVAAAAEQARRIQERLNVAHSGQGQDWSVVTAQHRYGLAKARFARRVLVALALLAAGFLAARDATGPVPLGLRGAALLLAALLILRAVRRLRASRQQLENALFWAGLTHPDRLASRNLDAQIAAVDINELHRAEDVLAAALRDWEALAGPNTDPADCEQLLAEARRQVETGLPEAHATWLAAREVVASAELAWRAALAELNVDVVDADHDGEVRATLRARAEAARRRAASETAALEAAARLEARATIRKAIAAHPPTDDALSWLAGLGAAPPPALVVVVDDGDFDPGPALARTFERLAGHAPVALITSAIGRWSGVIDVDLDLRDPGPEPEVAPERAWFASS
jgi:hypothetical protein